MSVHIEIDIDDVSDREANEKIVKAMLDAQNKLDHERRVLREERQWLEDAWTVGMDAGPPEFASQWAIAEHDRIMAARKR